MFTGIIQEVGEVRRVGDGVLRVRAPRTRAAARLGDSIAIDGVDLTVMEMGDSELAFNVMPETFRVTTLGRLAAGARVNLEPAVRAGHPLSGHLVRGVVEGTGTVAARREDGDAVIMTYAAPADLLACMIERGPVCVDGVSLTVISKTEATLSVSVVRFTQANTTVLDRQVGDPVNIETDILMRYVVQALRSAPRA